MPRAEIAYLLIAIVAAVAFAAIFLTLRYLRYQRRLARGHRKDKPVWKPFWLN